MDEIERLIRDAKPGVSRRGQPLTDRAETSLRTILEQQPTLSGTRRHRVTRRRRAAPRLRRPYLLSAASFTAVVLAVLLGVAGSSLPSTRALAVTPPMLVAEPIATSAHDVLIRAAEAAQREENPPGAPHTIRMHAWAYGPVIRGHEAGESSVVPEVRTIDFRDDGTVFVRVVAGEPFPGEATSGLPAPGTLLWEQTFTADEYVYPRDPPPTDPELVRAYLSPLRDEADDDGRETTGAYLNSIISVISSHTLTGKQEAALLRFFASLQGITVKGSVADRLGRPGIVLQAEDRAPHTVQDLLIVSPTTGRILAFETVYVGNDRDGLTAPAVTSYFVFD